MDMCKDFIALYDYFISPNAMNALHELWYSRTQVQ